jgi:hypothetical protein
MTAQLATYAGLISLAAIVIFLAKSNVLFPFAFNEAVRGLFGPPWAIIFLMSRIGSRGG